MRLQRLLNAVVPLLLVYSFLSTAQPGYSQVSYDTGTLQGTVLDSQGRAVPGATVSINNAATGLSKSMQSGEDGAYSFPLLPPGAYEVDVTATGFDKAVAKDVRLPVGQATTQDMHLTVGATTTVVEVTTSAPLVTVEQVQQADSITQTQVQELPNVNHTFDTLVLTLPGVSNVQTIRNATGSQRAGGGTFNAFTTGAGNGRGGLVYIDGGENDAGLGIARAYHLPVEAISEFQVNRSGYNAEYGFSYAEAVTIVTKGGTNSYHGNVFGTFRNESTDAHQYFQPLSRNGVYNSVIGNKPFDQEWHGGATLGGPIVKNRVFFFVSYERFQNAFLTGRSFTNVATYLGGTAGQAAYIADIAGASGVCGVESCATLAADLTAATNPSSQFVVNKLIGAVGKPNGGFPNQSGFFTNSDRWNDGIARVDWTPNSADSFVFRALAETRDNPGTIGGAEYSQSATAPPNAASVIANRDYEAIGVWNHIFTPTLFNAFRVQVVPEYTTNSAPIPSQQGTVIPNSSISGYGSFGVSLNAVVGSRIYEKRYQFEDSTSWTRGNHSIKFGASFRPAKYVLNNPLYRGSQVTYSSGQFTLYGLGGPFCANAASTLPGVGTGSTLSGAAGATCSSAGGANLGGNFTPPLTASDLSAINSFNGSAAFVAAHWTGANINALQSFSAVTPSAFRTSFGSGKFSGWGMYGGVYIQDTWKVNSRFTVSPGIRFDVNAEPFPTGGVDSNVCEPLAATVANVNALQTAIRNYAVAHGGAFGAPAIQSVCNAANGGVIRSFPINPTGSHTQYVSPRLGIAYALTSDNKTLVRAAAGTFVGVSELNALFYANIYNPNGANLIQEEVSVGADPGYYALIENSATAGHLPVLQPTLGDFNASGLAPVAEGPHSVYIVAGDSRNCGAGNPYSCGTYRSTYSTQASASIQRQLSTNMSLEVAYNYQRTFHVQDPQEQAWEQAVSATGDPGGAGVPLIDALQGPMLVPLNVNAETGTNYCSCGDAIYHALTASFKRQFAKGFQFQINWTYSKALDDVLDFSSFNSSYYATIYPLGINGHGRDYGLSAYNTTHNIVASGTYTTPFRSGSGSSLRDKLLADWTLSPIVTLRSGIPFQVGTVPATGLNVECTTVAACAAGSATGNGLTQEALFQARPYAAGRDTGFSPWNYRWDMSFRRGINLNAEKGIKLEFLANFANILNRVNFLGVNGTYNLGTLKAAAPNVTLLNGKLVNMVTGPYNFKGNAAFNQAEKLQQLCTLTSATPSTCNAQIGGAKPLANGTDFLAFQSADVPRQTQFQLKLSF